MTSQKSFQKVCDKTSSPPDTNIRRCFFAPTNRDKSPVWALFVEVGYDCEHFVCATQGEK